MATEKITKPSQLLRFLIDSGAYRRHGYMCHALDYWDTDRALQRRTKALCMKLVRSISPGCISLPGALVRHSRPESYTDCVEVYEAYIIQLQERGL